MRLTILISVLALIAVSPALPSGGDLPPVLDRIEEPERLTILAIDSSGDTDARL